MHQRQKQRPNKRQTTTTVAAAQLTPRLVNRAAGPAVLTTLQTRLERELADLPAAGSDTGWDRARLQVFGTCWDEMCHEFTNYRPLLTSIKSEYERFISHYEAELTRIEPQLELVKDLQTQKERTVRDTRAECAAATAKLKKAIEAADTERVMAEAESEKTARLLVRSNSELETTKGDIEQMHELNLSLMSSIQRYEGELKAQITLEEEEHRNVDTYKAQLDLLLHDYQHLLDQHADANDELVVVSGRTVCHPAAPRVVAALAEGMTPCLLRALCVPQYDCWSLRMCAAGLQRLTSCSYVFAAGIVAAGGQGTACEEAGGVPADFLMQGARVRSQRSQGQAQSLP